MDPLEAQRNEPPTLMFLRILLSEMPAKLYLVLNLAEYSRTWGRGRPIKARNTAIGASTFPRKLFAGEVVDEYPATELKTVPLMFAIFHQSKWPVAPVGRLTGPFG